MALARTMRALLISGERPQRLSPHRRFARDDSDSRTSRCSYPNLSKFSRQRGGGNRAPPTVKTSTMALTISERIAELEENYLIVLVHGEAERQRRADRLQEIMAELRILTEWKKL
jgi:hypothetical protein